MRATVVPSGVRKVKSGSTAAPVRRASGPTTDSVSTRVLKKTTGSPMGGWAYWSFMNATEPPRRRVRRTAIIEPGWNAASMPTEARQAVIFSWSQRGVSTVVTIVAATPSRAIAAAPASQEPRCALKKITPRPRA